MKINKQETLDVIRSNENSPQQKRKYIMIRGR